MNVAVVGCGLAGLRCAMLLEKEGANVELFEARSRIGGRLYRTANGDEAGAEWIDADHHRMLSLLHELGSNVWPSNIPYRIFYRGGCFLANALPDEARRDEERVRHAASQIAARLDPVPWKNERFANLDSRTLSEFLDEHCKSQMGRWWCEAIFRSDEGDDTARIGLLGWLCGYKLYLQRDSSAASSFRFDSGELVSRMAARLTSPPKLNHVLKKVANEELVFDCARCRADAVILCLPPAAYCDVPSDASVEKLRAFRAAEMSRAIKIVMEFSSPFWENEGWEGNALVDSPLQQVWNTSRGGRHLLCAYICGEDSLKFSEGSEAVELLSRFSPAAGSALVRASLYDWRKEAFSKGAFLHLAPGFVLNHMKHLRQPERRTHFAGEHTAVWTGFMEGALESAERAVQEVLSF